jgi:hypothetical protein
MPIHDHNDEAADAAVAHRYEHMLPGDRPHPLSPDGALLKAAYERHKARERGEPVPQPPLPVARQLGSADYSKILPNEVLRKSVEVFSDDDPAKRAVMGQTETVNNFGRHRQRLAEAYAQLGALQRRRLERMTKSIGDGSES